MTLTMLPALSIAELAEGICLRAGRIAAATAELLLWVAEFDRREGWAGPGMLSCAHWLSWRTGLAPGAAREQVRVARRLPELPELAAAFTAGSVSYSKVRAVTRAAEPEDGIDWVALARHSSGAQLERLVRGIRRVRATEAAEADPEQAAYRLRTRKRYDDDGNLTMTIYAPAEFAPLIEAGIEASRAELDRHRQAVWMAAPGRQPAGGGSQSGGRVSAETSPAGSSPAGSPGGSAGSPGSMGVDVPAETPEPATDGEALLAMAQTALTGESTAHPDAARRRRPQLIAQVDPLSGWFRLRDGELLPPAGLRGTLRALPSRERPLRLRPLTPADLRRHDQGRPSRDVPLALRELLASVDGERCRFPGCTRHRALHAHHVRYWSAGGPTDLANLVLLCSRHHTLVHAHGFQLALHPDRTLDVRTADGTVVLHHPAPPWGDPNTLDPDRHVSGETLLPEHAVARLDLRYAVGVLLQQAA